MAEIFALVVLRYKKPNLPRNKVPGGVLGLVYIVVAPLTIIVIAIVSQIMDYGWQGAVGLALIAMAVGAVLYFPIKKWVKKDIPDVDPYVLGTADEEAK